MNMPSDHPAESHYFTESPSSPSQREEFSIVVNGRALTLDAESGVFSRHGLDKGTAVLLRHVLEEPVTPLPPDATVCDLGCGSGSLALALGVLYPDATVLAIDINERARQLCTENARRNNITNVLVKHPDDVDPNITLSLLWSNPPIRIGKDALHDLLLTWLARLSQFGQARLVVGKNLGADSLTTWLSNQGYPARKVASSKGFRVLSVDAHQ